MNKYDKIFYFHCFITTVTVFISIEAMLGVLGINTIYLLSEVAKQKVE